MIKGLEYAVLYVILCSIKNLDSHLIRVGLRAEIPVVTRNSVVLGSNPLGSDVLPSELCIYIVHQTVLCSAVYMVLCTIKNY